MVDPCLINVPIIDKGDIIRFESRYESATLIPCCIGSCRRPHNKGIIVRLRNGELSRVGHVCGRRLLGSDQFTVLHREFTVRLQRELREKFITSPTFDPEGALASLTSWIERLRVIKRVRKHMADHGWLEALQIATEKQDGWFEVVNEQGIVRKTKLRGTKFLTTTWENLFDLAVIDLRSIARTRKKLELTERDLADVVFKASECHRRLKIVADIIDPIGPFLEAIGYLLEVEPFASFGPLDRTPIEKLVANTAPPSPSARSNAA
ncbi:MAG TPA: hypothetical protein VG651_04575 [Stellaceae bacterium]|nr:hypothetical protein [Stellaceae bacterium]